MASETALQPSTGATVEGGDPEIQVEVDTTPNVPGQPGRWTGYEGFIIGMGAVILFLAVWQAVAAARIYQPLFLPGPMDIVGAFGELINSGTLGNDLWVSFQELVYGYVMAVVFGLPLGILIGWYRRANYALDPFVNFFNATPRVALTPLFIIWFGIGIYSKIAVVFLGAIFPIIINTAAGVRNVDTNLVKAARSFGARDLDLFRTVALPGAVPFILSGLRLGIGHALTGVVVGELVAAQAGIGLMMATAGATFQTAKVFAGVIMISGAGVVFNIVLQRFEKRFQSWRPAR